MPSFAYVASSTLDGTSFGAQRTVTGTTPLKVLKDSFPVALAGILLTRTGNDVGVLQFVANPGLVAGNRIDVYWDTGGSGMRRGMLVSSVAGAGPYNVTVGTAGGDKGLGDNFPAAADPITVGVAQQFELLFTGNNAKALAAYADTKAAIVLASAADAELWAAFFKLANIASAKSWDNTDGTTNPVAGVSVAKVWMSHGDAVNTRALRVGVLA